MLREATVTDAHAIAQVQVNAWHAAYSGFLPRQLLDDMSVDLREASWRELLAVEEPAGFTLVAGKDEGPVAAFCSVVVPAATRPPVAGPPRWRPPMSRWGAGVGRSLVTAALDRLRAGSWDDVTLWGFLRNAQGRGFYARSGFRSDGERGVHEASGVPTARMRRALY